MSKIIITSRAKSDLIDIWLYIAEDNHSAADSFLDAIDRKCTLISESPNMGRTRDELSPALRSFPAGRYIIFYRLIKNGIEVIRVLSASRDMDSMFP